MRERGLNILGAWLLPLGLLALLNGLFIADSRSAHKTIVYLLWFAPVLLALVLDFPRWCRRVDPLVRWLAVFVLWAALSSLWAAQQAESDNFFKHGLLIVVFALGLSAAWSPGWARLRQTLCLAALLAAVYSVWALFVFYGREGHAWAIRFHGLSPLYNPLVSGYFMGFFVAWLMGDFIAGGSGRRQWPLWGLVAVPLVVFVLLTQSRTPLLAWLCTALVLTGVGRGRRSVFLAVATVIGLAGLLWLVPSLLERGLSYRPQIWWDALSRVPEHWLWGHGVGNELRIVLPERGWEFWDAHNMHLSVLYHTGVMGLGLWAVLWGLAFRRAWRHRHEAEGVWVLALLTYGFVACSFDGGYLIARPRENWVTLWLPLALAARLAVPLKKARYD